MPQLRNAIGGDLGIQRHGGEKITGSETDDKEGNERNSESNGKQIQKPTEDKP